MRRPLMWSAGLLVVFAVASAAAGARWTPPRTPWGDPDLQGTWDYKTITPLERPLAMAGRQFLTDEEKSDL